MKIEEPAFFKRTKRLHNLIHGRGDPALNAEDNKSAKSENRFYKKSAGLKTADGI